jgi:hypothetical protein
MPAGTESPFSDNLTGVCHDCGQGIIFRPHAPDVDKICVDCMYDRIDRGIENVEITATGKTIEEVRELIKKRGN